jgi:hypothetical protein
VIFDRSRASSRGKPGFDIFDPVGGCKTNCSVVRKCRKCNYF